jgi:hypothetical protein
MKVSQLCLKSMQRGNNFYLITKKYLYGKRKSF